MTWEAYDGSTVQQKRVEVLSLRTREKVVFLADKDGCKTIFIHWTPDGSRPCEGAKCPHCPKERRPQGYAPVAVLRIDDHGRPRYEDAILPITFGAFGLLDIIKRGSVVELWRRGQHNNGALLWKVIDFNKDLKRPSFCVQSRLEEMWNKREVKAKKKDGKTVPATTENDIGELSE